MQFTFTILPLFFSVGCLASLPAKGKINQYNCANHIISEADVKNFFQAAAVELSKIEKGQAPKKRLLHPYEPYPPNPSKKHKYYSHYAFRLPGTRVLKFVIINENGKPVGMTWGENAKYPCKRRRVMPEKAERPWNNKRQGDLWRKYSEQLPSSLRR